VIGGGHHLTVVRDPKSERKERKESEVAAGDIVPGEAARERELPLRHTA
jgi:hypothetical protein